MLQKNLLHFFNSKSVNLSDRAIWVWAKKGDYAENIFVQ